MKRIRFLDILPSLNERIPTGSDSFMLYTTFGGFLLLTN